jgi:formamidopyrimidine-DNA glycosylase
MEYFKNYMAGKKRTIKGLLMDQKFISGLGNIYVNEILFFSGVKPTKRIKKIKDFEIQKIVKFSKKIIAKAITLGGSSIKNFSSSSGKKGSFQQYFSVYGKKGKNCTKVKCIGKIEKIVIANRASFFCNKCQK